MYHIEWKCAFGFDEKFERFKMTLFFIFLGKLFTPIGRIAWKAWTFNRFSNVSVQLRKIIISNEKGLHKFVKNDEK